LPTAAATSAAASKTRRSIAENESPLCVGNFG
jgi:hypothetical protein